MSWQRSWENGTRSVWRPRKKVVEPVTPMWWRVPKRKERPKRSGKPGSAMQWRMRSSASALEMRSSASALEMRSSAMAKA